MRDGPARFDITKLQPMLEDVHERLSGVVIENLGFSEFIARYDRPGTLFYLDPPYWGSENDYGKGLFTRDDYASLATQLRALKGRFILSINDAADVRAIFKGFRIDPVQTTYTLAGGQHAKSAGELIITDPKKSRSNRR